MANYFRITAYNPAEDVGMIVDSNGRHEKLWQFSAELVAKGFKIFAVGNETKFTEGNIPKTESRPDGPEPRQNPILKAQDILLTRKQPCMYFLSFYIP